MVLLCSPWTKYGKSRLKYKEVKGEKIVVNRSQLAEADGPYPLPAIYYLLLQKERPAS